MLPIVIDEAIEVPEWVSDLASFRRWAHTRDFPERGIIAYCDGKLWIEPSMETVLHSQLRAEITRILSNLVRKQKSGRFFPDRMRLTHPEAGLSTEPDGIFLSLETYQRQRVQIKEGPLASEMVGSPDMVLEVVSTSSVRKDTVVLLELYFKAGIREYWLVDHRGKEVRFEIFQRGAEAFEAVQPRAGWLKSAVFGKAFRLTKDSDGMELPLFTLEVKRA